VQHNSRRLAADYVLKSDPVVKTHDTSSSLSRGVGQLFARAVDNVAAGFGGGGGGGGGGKRAYATSPSFVSPSNGTDLSHPISLIKCDNQTRCIQPYLQLKRTFDVYFCKHVGHGVRFYFLAREGLLLHPNVRLVSDPYKAEVIVYLPVSADWDKTECNKKEFKSKTVVLDEGDWPSLFEPDGPNSKEQWLLYFKRSYVQRKSGIFKQYMGYLQRPDILPMTYTIAEAYVRNSFPLVKERELDIVSTLRGSNADPVRLRVRQWVQEYCQARGLTKYVAGEVNHASRTVVSTGYLGQMYKAKIVVTSNPSDWEGDFRLMEAIASGALIFVDTMYVPRPYPLLHGQHVVYYDNNNKTDVFEKLDFYRSKTELARRVAVNGYLHAMKFHRAANLIDYVFRTIHIKMALASSVEEAKALQYTATGFHMHKLALDADKRNKERAAAKQAPIPPVA